MSPHSNSCDPLFRESMDWRFDAAGEREVGRGGGEKGRGEEEGRGGGGRKQEESEGGKGRGKVKEEVGERETNVH